LRKEKLRENKKRLIRFGAIAGAGLSRVPAAFLKFIPLAATVARFGHAFQTSLPSPLGQEAASVPKLACDFVPPTDIDWIVVGSGPGGASFAKHAKGEGKRVLVIEAGMELDPSSPPHSFEQMSKHFAHGGYDLILSNQIIPFAEGATWGGGSEVNSGLFHALPNSVALQWARILGVKEESFSRAVPEITSQLRVASQTLHPESPYHSSPLLRMGQHLGWSGGIVPRWRTYNGSDYVHHGAASTFLSVLSFSERLLNHRVSKIKILSDSVQALIEGDGCKHNVSAAKICLSAGTVSTPDILIKSNLARDSDFKFSFHAMIREVAVFDQKVNDLSDIDPHQFWSANHEFKIGAAVGTPDLLSAVMISKGIVEKPPLENVASFYISIASNGKGGLVRVLGDLYPYFFPSKEFKKRSIYAHKLLSDAIKDAGGRVLGQSGPSISTVHIFGSLPLGSNNILDKFGRLVAHPNRVIVRDASILPSHPLVNPQGPLLQLVHVLNENRESSK
jgi:hypothetical protein